MKINVKSLWWLWVRQRNCSHEGASSLKPTGCWRSLWISKSEPRLTTDNLYLFQKSWLECGKIMIVLLKYEGNGLCYLKVWITISPLDVSIELQQRGELAKNKSTSKIWCCEREKTGHLIFILEINRDQMLSSNSIYRWATPGNQTRRSLWVRVSVQRRPEARHRWILSLLMCRKN